VLLSQFGAAVSNEYHSPGATATPDDIYNMYQERKHEKRIFTALFSDIWHDLQRAKSAKTRKSTFFQLITLQNIKMS